MATSTSPRTPAPPPRTRARSARPIAFVGAGLLTTLAPAQQPQDPAALAKALAGNQAKDVAWACFGARESGDKDLARPLQQALATWRGRADDEAQVVRLHLLDALIGLDPRMPATDLVPLLHDPVCGTAAFVLLARDPIQNERELLALFRDGWGAADPAAGVSPQTEALGTLLASRRAPGFAAAVCERTDFDAYVVVMNHEPETPRRARRTQFVQATELRFPEPGWPPYPNYGFRASRAAGKGVWKAVPMPAPLADCGLERATALEPLIDRAMLAVPRPVPKSQWPGADWLFAMAGLAAKPREQVVVFSTDEDLLAAAGEARAQRQAMLFTLRERLVANGAMTPQEAKVLRYRVQAHLIDKRNDLRTALPTIPTAR